MNLKDLHKPFAPNKISWRVGSTNADKSKGMALAYIDARDVMERLHEVCGPYWQNEYVPMPNGTCCCRIGIKVGDEWLWRSNGSMNLTDSDKADAKEMAEKGSYSDAFKRSAVLWGIGQYLYALDSPWVALEPAGRSFKIAAHEYRRLEGILAKSAPSGSGAISHNPEPTKQSEPSHEEDHDGQVKAWCDKEIAKLSIMTRLPDVLMWQDEREAELSRLQRKSPAMHRYLMDFFQKVQKLINEKGTAQ